MIVCLVIFFMGIRKSFNLHFFDRNNLDIISFFFFFEIKIQKACLFPRNRHLKPFDDSDDSEDNDDNDDNDDSDDNYDLQSNLIKTV
jgi:hypothetical protein